MVDFEKVLKDELSANFVSADTLITDESVFELAYEFKQVRAAKKATENKLIELKGLILAAMKHLNMRALAGKEAQISVQYPASFDQGLCAMDHAELCAKYISTDIITTEVKKFNKNLFKKHHPKLFEEYSVALTARLTVK